MIKFLKQLQLSQTNLTRKETDLSTQENFDQLSYTKIENMKQSI